MIEVNRTGSTNFYDMLAFPLSSFSCDCPSIISFFSNNFLLCVSACLCAFVCVSWQRPRWDCAYCVKLLQVCFTTFPCVLKHPVGEKISVLPHSPWFLCRERLSFTVLYKVLFRLGLFMMLALFVFTPMYKYIFVLAVLGLVQALYFGLQQPLGTARDCLPLNVCVCMRDVFAWVDTVCFSVLYVRVYVRGDSFPCVAVCAC